MLRKNWQWLSKQNKLSVASISPGLTSQPSQTWQTLSCHVCKVLIVRNNFLSDLFHIDRSWVRLFSRVALNVNVCFGFALNYKTMQKLLCCRLLGRLRCQVTGFWNPDKDVCCLPEHVLGINLLFMLTFSPLCFIREWGNIGLWYRLPVLCPLLVSVEPEFSFNLYQYVIRGNLPLHF